MNKVYGGTVRHHDGPSLCLSCRNATVIHTMRDVLVNCRVLYTDSVPYMDQPVIKCSSYDDKNHPSEQDFRMTGWILDTNKSGEVIGFVNPKAWKERQKKENGYDE